MPRTESGTGYALSRYLMGGGWWDGWWACLPAASVFGAQQCSGIAHSLPAPQVEGSLCEGGKGWGSLVQVLQSEGLCGKADVAVAIEPHSKWVPVGHQEPLSQVKLGIKDEQGPLDILLYHPLAILHHHGVTVHQFQHLLQVVHAHDA